MTSPLVRLDGVVRHFGSVTALDGASLELRAGEVHGVLGENGAGKSTLFGVLGGLLQPDRGTLVIDGSEVSLRSPRDAWAHGVGLVHQHFTLVPRLTALENLALGRRTASGGWRLPLDEVRSRASQLMEETGLHVPLEASVETLGVGDRQRIEILKTLLREPRIVVLDEPTAVLAPPEVARLFDLLRGLAGDGRAVALVAHKLDEVLSVSDRVTVLRRGRTVLTAARGDVDATALAQAMVGADGPEDAGRQPARTPVPSTQKEVVARCSGVRLHDLGRSAARSTASLEVHRGEIVGVAGVEGNGQRELARLMAGRSVAEEGTVELPQRVGFIPQDRTREGLALEFSLAENVALLLHRTGTGPVLDWSAIEERAERIRDEYDVKAQSVRAPARALSGGNQQRVVVGRELDSEPDFLVAENPTRGLDVAATDFVHSTLRRLVAGEAAPGILLISTDLDEVLELSDRVFAVVRGELIAVAEDDRTREGVGRIMLGGTAV